MPRKALSAALVGALLAMAAPVSAYDRQISLDVAAGWGIAPALSGLPNHGPGATVGAAIGFDDTWGLGVYGGWAVHPPLTDGAAPTFHVGFAGVEALYYFDILQIVPFFGAGVDVLPNTDGSNWGADFAAHLRISVDYLVSREVTVGVDIRPYILFTALPDINPVYLTFQARVSFLFDY